MGDRAALAALVVGAAHFLWEAVRQARLEMAETRVRRESREGITHLGQHVSE